MPGTIASQPNNTRYSKPETPTSNVAIGSTACNGSTSTASNGATTNGTGNGAATNGTGNGAASIVPQKVSAEPGSPSSSEYGTPPQSPCVSLQSPLSQGMPVE